MLGASGPMLWRPPLPFSSAPWSPRASSRAHFGASTSALWAPRPPGLMRVRSAEELSALRSGSCVASVAAPI
eukprot:12832129-Alexandrium_andersonii.AAC.1